MSAPPHGPPEVAATRRAWWALAVLFAAQVSSFVDRAVVFVLAVPIKSEFALSDTQLSLLMGVAFSIFYVGFGLPLGRVVDRSSRRTTAALGILGWSLATASSGIARSFDQLLLARAAVGIGEAALAPAAYSMIADLFPRHRVGTASGIFAAGSYVGAGLSTLLGGLLATAVGSGAVDLPIAGATPRWQTVFLWLGLPGLLVAALMLTVREPPRRGGDGRRVIPLAEVARHLGGHARLFTAFLGASGLLGLGAYGLQAWTVTFLVRTHGWTLGEAGTVQALGALLGGAVGIAVGGRWADRLIHRGVESGRLQVAIVAALASIPLLAGFVFARPAPLATLIYVPLVFANGLPWGALAATISDIAPNRMRGQVVAVYLLVQNLVGLGLGPTAVALVTDRLFADEAALGVALVLVGGAAFALAALLLLWGIPRLAAARAVLSERP